MQLVKSHNNRLNEQMSFVEHGARKDPHGPTPLTSVAAYLSAFATVNCYPSIYRLPLSSLFLSFSLQPKCAQPSYSSDVGNDKDLGTIKPKRMLGCSFLIRISTMFVFTQKLKNFCLKLVGVKGEPNKEVRKSRM